MSVISSGRPERKDVTEAIEKWKKESAAKKLRMQQEWAKKGRSLFFLKVLPPNDFIAWID